MSCEALGAISQTIYLLVMDILQEYHFGSTFDSADGVMSQFCARHDISAVVACGKMCHVVCVYNNYFL